MPNKAPVLGALHKLIQQGLRRCLTNTSDSSSGQRSSFHDWCDVQQPQQTCHTALELDEVLVQVFKHLDSWTLCTTIPLVCQHWKAAAASDQIWAPLCDPLLLAVVQQQVPAAAQTANTTDARAKATPLSTPLDTPTELSHNIDITSAAAAARSCYSVALPLLHHAVYKYNLLRNPTFVEAANADYSSALQRTRSGSSNSGAAGKPHAVLTANQRKVAWVATVGTPSWEVAPASSAHTAGSFQPPLPLEYPLTPTTSSSSRLQEWFFGSSKTAANTTVPTATSSNGNSNGTDASSSVSSSTNSSSATGSMAQHEDGHGVSFLATGSNWTEVVQVIDLMGELTARGLDASTAATILDQGVLAICLTFWVAAAPDTPALHSTPQPDNSIDAEHASGQQATAGHSGVRLQASHTHQQSPAQFAAALMLDGGQVPLRSFQTFVRNDSSHHFFSKRLAVDAADGWRRYAYVVPCCPKGLRRAVVLLRGRGTGPGSNAAMAALATGSTGSSGSSGTGGVQFACAQLRFIRHDEVEGMGADECLAGWQDRVVHGF